MSTRVKSSLKARRRDCSDSGTRWPSTSFFKLTVFCQSFSQSERLHFPTVGPILYWMPEIQRALAAENITGLEEGDHHDGY